MNSLRKGLLVGLIQILIVLSLGAKLLYDRATRPRVWVLSQVYDPELPIRGRYLAQQLHVPTEGFTYVEPKKDNNYEWYANRSWAYLEVRGSQLIATRVGTGAGLWISLHKNADGTLFAVTEPAVLVFIPERANIPTLQRGQEMWVEVTIPAKGPPRPIRIGLKKDGVITPLQLN